MPITFKRKDSGVFVPITGYYRTLGSFTGIGDGGAPTPGASPLAGVGSVDNSLTLYPKTAPRTSGDFIVDPVSGNDSNAGTIGAPFLTLGKALSLAEEGVVILVRGGTLNISSRITRSTSWTTGIKVFNYGTEKPILNFTGGGTGSAGRLLYFTSSSRREHWKGFEYKGANERTIMIEGQHTKIEDGWVHNGLGDGIYMANFTGVEEGYNLIQDMAITRLGDGSSTGTNVPDGIVVTANSGSVRRYETIARCFIAHGPDDCVDLFRGRSCKVYDSVGAFGGYYWNGNSAGDGGNFKMGGREAAGGDNLLVGSLAIGAKGESIKPNNAQIAGQFLRNTSIDSDYGFTLDDEGHLFQDNLSFGNGTNVLLGSPSTQRNNSWNLGNPNPAFANAAGYDWSLSGGSPAIGAGYEGGNLGASQTALEVALERFSTLDLTA